MKIVGIVLIVCTCAGIGITAAWRIRNTEALWKAWALFLQRLHSSLRYTAAPIGELIGTIRKEDLQALPWLMHYHPSSDDSWCPDGLQDEERTFAEAFFSHLGTTDLEGQLRHIEHHVHLAQQAERAARERQERLSKAYVTTGICAGLCVGIMLI